MFATLALTLLIAKESPAPTMSADMVSRISIASQQYGSPAVPVSQLSRATGLYMSPTDDIWVYQHASDPQKDEFIRAWGVDGHAVPLPGDDPAAASWSILKWDLSGFSDKSKLQEVQLILNVSPGAGFTVADAQAAPLEVRAVKPGFSEGKWDYAEANIYGPIGTESEVFGDAFPATVDPAGFKIVIDLMKGPSNFREYFEKAMKKDKIIALAITSRIDPSKVGREGIYKLYSKDAADPMLRPALRVVLDKK